MVFYDSSRMIPPTGCQKEAAAHYFCSDVSFLPRCEFSHLLVRTEKSDTKLDAKEIVNRTAGVFN